MNNEAPIIIALDVDSASAARSLVRAIGPRARFYKVGMELYAAAGSEFVRELIAEGNRVFLDLKFYDIGETVKRAVSVVAGMGVEFLTIHAVGQVVRAAVEGAAGSNLTLLAVTVLTSFDESDVREMGYECSVRELVVQRVHTAVTAGAGGVVCSPLEVRQVRSAAGPDVVLVTPGVRTAGATVGDQKRVSTPKQALQDGADYLVIGRQVTRAADPAGELERIVAEIGELNRTRGGLGGRPQVEGLPH